MKKIYNVLEIYVKLFDSEDIITTSGDQPTTVDDFDNRMADIFS